MSETTVRADLCDHGEVVATKRGDLPYTRLEAAEAMAAHWAKMEAEGDA